MTYTERTKKDCPCCENGFVEILLNPTGFHFEGDEPIIEYTSCEQCGGTGFIMID